MTTNRQDDQTVTTTILDQYVAAVMKHGSATENGNSDEANAAYRELERVFAEIEKAGCREDLIQLLTHKNPSVRAEAAFHTYVLDAHRSESVLEEVASGPGMVAFGAGMTLKQLKNGGLKAK